MKTQEQSAVPSAGSTSSADEQGSEELAEILVRVLRDQWRRPQVRGKCTGEPNWFAIKFIFKTLATELGKPNTEVSSGAKTT